MLDIALPSADALISLAQVIMIDLALAGDNAVAVGLAAAGLPAAQRRKAILYGLIAAVVLRVGLAIVTVQLLQMIGLLLAGGILLLWVCWKMWRDLREGHVAEAAEAAEALEDATGVEFDGEPTTIPRTKTMRQAMIQILLADVAMSLDNVLAVAGAAREHAWVLVVGLLLSIALMGLAATWIASLLQRYRWLGFAGLAIVFYVALHMIWQGHRSVVIDLGHTPAYNTTAPDVVDISPEEEKSREALTGR
jgi:YjbE family integral membrane protein